MVKESEYAMGDIIIVIKPLPESKIDAPAIRKLYPGVEKSHHSTIAVFYEPNSTLMIYKGL
ncbi:hypothetical protein Q666_16845 [Marinobacter sp. ES-1]|nr:hypothetical protein Q666_16845 [Marinobacter sp. ES-1]|tara:strand:- start:1179 stop:1361 length:183 start_codon:yes stop_codon:yes gene_type:complete